MVGGKIIENAVVTLTDMGGKAFTRRRLWCVDHGDECAVYVEELLPCPHCGNAPQPVPQNSTRPHLLNGWWRFIWCEQCDAQGPLRETEADAIAAWNRRSVPAVSEEADMRAFGASDAACVYYPGEDQQKERAAFIAGASIDGAQSRTAEARAAFFKAIDECIAIADEHTTASSALSGTEAARLTAKSIAAAIRYFRSDRLVDDGLGGRRSHFRSYGRAEVSRKYSYENGATSRHGTMICAKCGKRIGDEPYRVYQKTKHFDWSYVNHCRPCSEDDPGWAEHDREMAAIAASAAERAADEAAFAAKWGYTP